MLQTNTYGEPITLAVAAPAIQAYDLTFESVGSFDESFDESFGGSSGVLAYTRGNGSKCLVLISRNPITFSPFDGVTYLLGQTFSDGSFVMAKGSNDSVDLTTLEPGIWYVRVFEFNGSASTEMYNRSEAINNPKQIEI